MAEIVIKTQGLTKDYGNQRGIFDINLEIARGEVYGFVGTNGSGKTTTIRNMMGFVKGDEGKVSILGMDAWQDAVELKKYVSYVPGEIAFPSVGTGTDFLKLQAEYLGITDFTYMNRLIKMLQLDPTANLKRMSKGMKQKTALVAALMGDKDILILDEPTTGLDPLMRDTFIELIREEKAKGKTIFMSSHIFEEIEEVCDKVSMIKDGKILGTLNLKEYKNAPKRSFLTVFRSEEDANDFAKRIETKSEDKADGFGWQCEQCDVLSLKIVFEAGQTKDFLALCGQYNLKRLSEHRETLEDAFMRMYREGEK